MRNMGFKIFLLLCFFQFSQGTDSLSRDGMELHWDNFGMWDSNHDAKEAGVWVFS